MELDAVANFGDPDADRDELLEKCFESHNAYLQLRSHSKAVILGRKGSGKTAIFRRMKKITDNNVFVSGHVFSEYPWHHHAKQRQVGVPEEHCFIQSWEYLIYIELSKLLLHKDASQPWSDAAQDDLIKLSDFISDTYGSTEPDIVQIFSPTQKLHLKGELAVKAKFLEAKATGEFIPLTYLPSLVSEINRTLLRKVVNCANPECHYFICFDELDLGFSLEKTEYKNQLTGLLLAARRVNNLARYEKKNISIVIFLRDDIYNIIHFEDKNKITESDVSLIQWDIGGSSSTLRAIMEKRFETTLGITENGAWREVFNEDKEMSSRQSKYNHILDRTFLRPRDVIKFSNEILSSYKRDTKERTGKFENEHVIEARTAYSNYLLKELDDEIPKHHPEYKSYLEIIKRIGTVLFSNEEFHQTYDELKSTLKLNIEAKEVLGNLFEFSIIGYYKPGGLQGGANFVWRYKNLDARFDDKATQFRTHLGLIETLGLKRFSKQSQFSGI